MEAYAPTVDELEAQSDAALAADPVEEDVPTVLGIPLERILTIGRTPINIAAASVASWLMVHVHLLSLFHVQHDGLATAIEQGVIWVVTAILTDRSLAQWVDNLVKHRQTKATLHAAAIQAVASGGPEAGTITPQASEVYDPTVHSVEEPLTPQEVQDFDVAHGYTEDPEAEAATDLPSDAEESSGAPRGE